jgi:hypothetical protein
MRKREETQLQCSLCHRDFDLQVERGARGAVGILPCAFCPTCLDGIRDMVEQLWPCPHCLDEEAADGSHLLELAPRIH